MIDKAKIKISTKVQKEGTINPYIFGNFVEDIRDHMEAMLSYALKDMDFESEDDNNDGVSGCWYRINNGKNTVYNVEPAAYQHSGHCQMMRIFSDDRCRAGIAQKISVKGNMGYHIKVYARASMDVKKLYVQVCDLNSKRVLGSGIININGHDWKEYTASIHIDEDCSNAEFSIAISSEEDTFMDSIVTGIVWIDHVSMVPADSVGNVKKEIFEMTKSLNCGMMRLSGNYISAYHFKYGIGPMYLRPSLVNETWGGWASMKFGTDEFLKFCNDLGVEPMICVNFGSGTPEEAAEWVEYCNGDETTPMGRLRAENGRKEPYNVKYWEVGNEVWGPWQVGHCNAEEYAKRYIEFYNAMKKADPNILFLGCGHIQMDWNKTVLDIAGEYMDYLTIHIYHSYRQLGIDDNAPKEDRFKGIVCFPEVTRSIIEGTKNLIKANSKHSHLKLAITEYNTMYFPNFMRKGLPNELTLEAAVANAANLNEYLRNSDIIEIGSFSDLVNGWLGGCIRVGDIYADQVKGKVPSDTHTVYGSPTYYVLKAYGNADIHKVLESKVDCSTFDVSAPNSKVNLKELPTIDSVSCINKDMDKVTVFAVNRGLEDLQVNISLDDFEIADAVKISEICGDDLDVINSPAYPENVVSKYFEVNKDELDEIVLKAHSVYVFELSGSSK